MKLSVKDEAALFRAVQDLRVLYGTDLLGVALYGEAASGGYRLDRSPLSLAVVVKEVSPGTLQPLRPLLARWRRWRISTPLLFDPPYIETALDTFPLEFLDFSLRYRRLYGDSDFFVTSGIDVQHLRLEVEEQLRGKLLHLWKAYLEVGGSKRRLRSLLVETPPGFALILRGLLWLHMRKQGAGQAALPSGEADSPDALLSAVEGTFGLELPIFHRLESVRRGEERLVRDAVESVFEVYLREVRQLVRLADSL